MIVREKIFESPDIISYPDLQYNAYGEPVDENEWSPQFGDDDSHPIWLSDGELVLGKARDAHPLNIRHTEDFYPGRLWKERKMISFWVYPEKDLFFKMIEGLSARLSRYYNENIDILRDPEWKIEILPQKKEAWRGLTYVKERNPEVWHSELIPVKDYEGSAQRSAEDLGQEHVKSPMQKKERDKVGGSKKYGKEKPLAWRQALVPESLEEALDFERGNPNIKKSIGVGMDHLIKLEEHRPGSWYSWTYKDHEFILSYWTDGFHPDDGGRYVHGKNVKGYDLKVRFPYSRGDKHIKKTGVIKKPMSYEEVGKIGLDLIKKAIAEGKLNESMKFERGEDPKKIMGIGKEALTVWRCGHCGVPTDEDGYPYTDTYDEFKRTLDIDQKMKGETTEQTQCDQCMNELITQKDEEYAEWEEEQAELRHWETGE